MLGTTPPLLEILFAATARGDAKSSGTDSSSVPRAAATGGALDDDEEAGREAVPGEVAYCIQLVYSFWAFELG